MTKLYTDLYTNLFPSPSGVSYLLIEVYALTTAPDEFPSPSGVSYLLISAYHYEQCRNGSFRPLPGFLIFLLAFGRNMPGYQSFRPLPGFLIFLWKGGNMYHRFTRFPSPSGVSYLLIPCGTSTEKPGAVSVPFRGFLSSYFF